MDRVSYVSGANGGNSAVRWTYGWSSQTAEEKIDQGAEETKQLSQEEIAARQEEIEEQAAVYRQKKGEEARTGNSLVDQLNAKANSIKNAFDPKKKKNLYDATMDLTLIAQAEKEAALRAIKSRLLFKIRSIKASGAESGEIKSAVRKLNKVLGKVKNKIKNLQKEEELEKKRKKAAEIKRKAKEQALRRELEMRRKIRKTRERNDIEESKMGLGCNDGGPTGSSAIDEYLLEHSLSSYEGVGAANIESLMASMEGVGSVVDVAVEGVGAVSADAVVLDVTV